MSTLRVSNIEAKADASSPSVNEKVKVTNSSGELLVHLDGATTGITTVGITTTEKTFDVDAAQNVTFVGDVSTPGNISVGGTLTYEDVTNVDSIGIITARTGVRVLEGDFLLVGAASSVGIATDSPACSVDASNATDGFALPQGTTTQRPTGDNPFLRFNTTNSALEFYNGTEWVEIVTDYFPTGSVILG